MSQQDQSKLRHEEGFPDVRPDGKREGKKNDGTKAPFREWFPEDDDEWYEPDYRRPERGS